MVLYNLQLKSETLKSFIHLVKDIILQVQLYKIAPPYILKQILFDFVALASTEFWYEFENFCLEEGNDILNLKNTIVSFNVVISSKFCGILKL